jgi:hypothetical protein
MSHLQILYLPQSARVAINLLFVVLVVASAIVRGGLAERILALTWLGPDYQFSVAFRELFCKDMCMGEPLSGLISLTCDLVMLAACVWAARRVDRYWVIWAGSFAMVSVFTDALVVLVPSVTIWSHMAADVLWWYLIGAAIAWGALGRRDEAAPAAPHPPT